MPLTFTETPLYYKDSQGNYHRILSGADMTGYRTAAAQDAIDAGLVSAAAAQTLTNAQQAQARNNIGAIDAGSIATIESSPATQAHAVGDYIVYNGQLYKVTAAISAGESLSVGTNVETATMISAVNTLIKTGVVTDTTNTDGNIAGPSTNSVLVLSACPDRLYNSSVMSVFISKNVAKTNYIFHNVNGSAVPINTQSVRVDYTYIDLI